VAFKPTAKRYSQLGVYPLSRSLDSVGFMAPSVSCCIRVDKVLAKEEYWNEDIFVKEPLRLGVLENIVLDGLDLDVKTNFERSLNILRSMGAHLFNVHSSVVYRVLEICKDSPESSLQKHMPNLRRFSIIKVNSWILELHLELLKGKMLALQPIFERCKSAMS
jgi:Asp-tRNA(Asn)/Glu-tRNA(Gln) amidotransferase A subunit family amidase